MEQNYWQYMRDKRYFWPVVGIGGASYWTAQEHEDLRELEFGLVSLTWRLDFSRVSRYRSSLSDYQQAKEQLASKQQEVERAGLDNYNSLERKRLDIKQMKADIALKEVQLAKAKQEYEKGLMLASDLMKTQLALTDAEQKAFSEEASLVQSAIALRHNLGLAWNQY